MRKNFGPNTYLYPQPVLIVGTYNEDGTANAMNGAWGGICGRPKLALNIGYGHKTSDNIKRAGAFTVHIADEAHMAEADYFGLVSGKNEDKIAKAGMHTEKSQFVDAPVITEFPVALECKVEDIQDQGGLMRVVGQIVNVSMDERVLDADGSLDFNKLNAISFDAMKHAYLKLGGQVGNAYSDGNKIK